MGKKLLTALGFILPAVAISFFQTGDVPSCVIPDNVAAQEDIQNQTATSDHLYQVWCGGVY